MLNRRTFIGSIGAALGCASYSVPLAAPEREASLVRPTFAVAPGLMSVFYEYLKDKPEYKDFLKQC